MELIGTFGFHCSNDRDKFAACKADFDAEGVPYVAEQACARFSSRAWCRRSTWARTCCSWAKWRRPSAWVPASP